MLGHARRSGLTGTICRYIHGPILILLVDFQRVVMLFLWPCRGLQVWVPGHARTDNGGTA